MLDFPGFNGRLASEKCIPSMDLLVDAVSDLLDWLEPDTILGHSLGGWLTARYAADCGAGLRPKTGAGTWLRGSQASPARGGGRCLRKRGGARTGRPDLRGACRATAGSPRSGRISSPKSPAWFDWVADRFSKFAADSGIRQFTESVREDHLLEKSLGQVHACAPGSYGAKRTR